MPGVSVEKHCIQLVVVGRISAAEQNVDWDPYEVLALACAEEKTTMILLHHKNLDGINHGHHYNYSSSVFWLFEKYVELAAMWNQGDCGSLMMIVG